MLKLSTQPWKTRRLKRYKLTIVGFGDVGQRLSMQLNPQIEVLAYGRRTPHKTVNMRFIPLDLDTRSTLKRISGTARNVIYLAPPPSQPAQSTQDPRIKRFLASARTLKRCIYVSTTGVYGKADGAWVTETTATQPTQARGMRRLAAERALKSSSTPFVSILRAPGIYAYDTHSQRLPIERIQAQLPALVEADDVPTNHIHADDLARLCWLALFKARNRRSYNAADGQPMMHGNYLHAVAQHFALPAPPQLPRAQVQAALSPLAWSMLADGRRVSSQRLLQEWDICLKYPNVMTFLNAMSEFKIDSHSVKPLAPTPPSPER